MTDTQKTNSPLFCKGWECPEIKRLDERVDKIYVKLDSIIAGIFTVLVTIIGSLLI